MSFRVDELNLTRGAGDPRLRFQVSMIANEQAEEYPGYVPSLSVDPAQSLLIWSLNAPADCKNVVNGVVDFSLFNGISLGNVKAVEQNGLCLMKGGVIIKEPKMPPPKKNYQVTLDLCVLQSNWKRISPSDFMLNAAFNHSPTSMFSYTPAGYALVTSPSGVPYMVFYVERTTAPRTDLLFTGVLVNVEGYNEINKLRLMLWDKADGEGVVWTEPVTSFIEICFKQV